MDKKLKTPRENTHACLNTKSNSNLNTARLSATQKHEKGTKPKASAETQPLRNFRFSTNSEQNTRKTYRKNSEKTIKPPEKQNKSFCSGSDSRSIASSVVDHSAVLQRGKSQISIHAACLATGERSITDNIDPQFIAPFKRVDTKTIDELEKRLENLQSILLRKIEIIKSRCPEKLKKEYKFIALVVGDESKLLIKESDAKCFPSCLPAKSIEDLNRKTSEFFLACLLLFVDKLRLYQDKGRSINCNEIYEDLKKEENDYCNILQDWINGFCEDGDKTLMPQEQEAPKRVQCYHQEVQTEEEQSLSKKAFAEQFVQTDIYEDDSSTKNKELTAKMDNLRLKNYELRDQLMEQKQNFMQEIEALKQKHKEKVADVMDSWQKEIREKNHKDEVCSEERKINEDLSQQVIELTGQLNELKYKNEELQCEQQKDEDAKSELEKLQIEYEQLQNENLELQELKSHFLKKLDQRYVRIELQEKELKMQKRTIQTKTEEIVQLKKQFDAKAKENRQNKESLEARNKLIDHLRNAVEIDQKKIREYELLLESKLKPSEPAEEEQEVERDIKLKRVKSKSTHMSRNKSTKKTTQVATDFSKATTYNHLFDADLLASMGQNNEKNTGRQPNRAERHKKKDLPFSEQDTAFDIKAFQEVLSADNSSEMEKSPIRNIRPRKRTRDIVVKKYDV